MRSNPTILLCSGETSGDIHAAQLVRHLRDRLPDARILAMGGDRCRDAGAELLFHYRDYAVLGFSGVLANLPRFLRLERSLKARLRDGVDLFIPVDYPGLNLRLASYARGRGVPVLYYISPQVWAWGAGRLDKMARSVDRMAVILPFEKDLYRRRGIPVEFVGHPFVVDHELPDPLPGSEREGVGLLPGSRVQEVSRVLPVLLKTARAMREGGGDGGACGFTIGRSREVPDSLYRSIIASAGEGLDVAVDDDAVGVMRRSRLLLVASGTATLQGALMQTPLVIVYKVSELNYFLARRLIKIPNIGLVNVILGDRVCPEFIQGDATAERIAPAALELLPGAGPREAMLARFEQLRRMLGGGGGCARVAEMAADLLEAL
jgi:lipid-A-disaccharide synthase